MPAIVSDGARKPRPRRILSLDGGGIRGAFALKVLARVEALFRGHLDRHDLVLADEFDLIAGTGTGAILAALLSWGLSVGQIEQLLAAESKRMAVKPSWSEKWRNRYVAKFVTESLRRFFSEDGKGREPAIVGTRRLRTLLLLVLRNASTGAPWLVSNNRRLPNPGLAIPLWSLARASAEAPAAFPPERIPLAGGDVILADGGPTPYGNPALAAFLMATLPGYGLGWETGVDKLHVVSVGCGGLPEAHGKAAAAHPEPNEAALVHSVSVEQDLFCRVLGHCRWGEPIDFEIGALTKEEGRLLPLSERKFSYVRYDHAFTAPEAKRIGAAAAGGARIQLLRELGREFAQRSIVPWHMGLPATPHATR